MTHAELQEQVSQLLRMTGWTFLHVRKSMASGGRGRGPKGWVTTTNIKGWPDLAPIWNPRQPGRFLAIELKVPPDRLSSDQVEVMASLESAGFECSVVTPDDLQALASRLRRPGSTTAHV